MTEVVDQLPETRHRDPPAPRAVLPLQGRSNAGDLSEAICRALDASHEPLTPAKLRAQLPVALRRVSPEDLTDTLNRQVEAGVLYAYCPYRSQQPRYWSRPLTDHVIALIGTVLADGPLTWSQLLRKLPEYAACRAEEVLFGQLAQGRLHRHPGIGPRGGERYGVQPPDPRGPVRQELAKVFDRLRQRLGFTEEQLRAAALEVLQDDEWSQPQDTTSSEPRYQE